MVNKNIEFRVGVIILIGIIILAGSLYWLQAYNLRANSQRVTVFFDDVGTLTAGDVVTVSGVRKGKVDNLRLTPQGVEVELWLSQDVMLRDDAQIVIKNLGLMGERFVAIKPGRSGDLLDLGQPTRGLYDTGLERVVGRLDTLSISAREFADNLNNPDGSLQLLMNDRRLYDDLRKTADNIDDLVSDIRANPRKYINLTLEIF